MIDWACNNFLSQANRLCHVVDLVSAVALFLQVTATSTVGKQQPFIRPFLKLKARIHFMLECQGECFQVLVFPPRSIASDPWSDRTLVLSLLLFSTIWTFGLLSSPSLYPVRLRECDWAFLAARIFTSTTISISSSFNNLSTTFSTIYPTWLQSLSLSVECQLVNNLYLLSWHDFFFLKGKAAQVLCCGYIPAKKTRKKVKPFLAM